MTIDDFFNRLAEDNRTTPGTHTFHAGVTDSQLAAWLRRNPGISIPDDLVAVLRRSNGLGLHQCWLDDGAPMYPEGCGALEIYALDGLRSANEDMYRCPDFERLALNWMAFGSGLDSNVYFVFDVATKHFLHLSPIVPDEATDVGVEIDDILDILISAITP